MNMFRFLSMLSIFYLFVTPVFAEEKVVDGFSVNLGIISWEQIQESMKEKPAAHTEGYHYKIAREMAKMHKGGKKGTHHILVVLNDKKTGRRIDQADVKVNVISRVLPQNEIIKLKPMTIDEYSGFGEFVKIRYKGPYILLVIFRLSEKDEFKEVKFVQEFGG